MKPILPIETLPAESGHLLGGKGESLRQLSETGLRIPRTLCVTTRAYHEFVDSAGLREKINLELSRKIFSQMRWEEVWDASQRIRLLFLRAPMPENMRTEVAQGISGTFGDRATVVRSSAPDEDRSGHSFAGLHASFTHLHGADDVIRHVRLVWASLWSDSALLYRKELGMNMQNSAMAVIRVVTWESTMVHRALPKPPSILDRTGLPRAYSSLIRSNIKTLASTAMPMESTMPAIPGRVRRA